jgi:hypothetical protein
MESELQQSEIDRLRAEVESYRQRELADLRSALAAAIAERDNYRSEAYRNAEAGRQIHAACQEEIARLRSQIEIKDQVALQLRRPNANAARN